MHPTCRLLCPLLSVTLLLFPSASCRRGPKTKLEPLDEIVRKTDVPPPAEPVKRDLEEIRARGTLTVLAPYNSTTYFVYRGEPLGYEYELLREFAASRLVPTPETEAQAAFTRALYQTEPALVQQAEAPEAAGKAAEKALAPGPA